MLTVLFSLQFALAEPPCDPEDTPKTAVARDLDRLLNDQEYLEFLTTEFPPPKAELPDPFAPTPQEDCNKKGLSGEEQAELARLKQEKQALDSLIKALREAKKGQIPIDATKDFIGSEVGQKVMEELLQDAEELRKNDPNFAKTVQDLILTGDTSSLPEEYQVLLGVITEAAGAAGLPPLNVQGAAVSVATHLLLGAEFAPAVGLTIFVGTQSYDGAIKVGQTQEAAAMAALYQMAAEAVVDGKTSAFNDSSVDTLLKSPEGKALIRQATGANPPLPLQRGPGILDNLFEDRFNEAQTQQWMKANAMDIYTYLNLYMEAGGEYPLALYKDLVNRGFLPERYAQDNWRENVLPHHQRARAALDGRIRALEEKARKNCR